MDAYTVEESIAEGQKEVENLFEFVRTQADQLEAHMMEKEIFKRVLGIGQAAMKTFFAEKGTGDKGDQIERDDGVVLKRESILRPKTYASIFGTFPVPRTCYRSPGEPGIFPLDQEANLPERRYSYFLQEWMNQLSIDHPFQEGAERLNHFFGLSLVESVMVDVSRDAPIDYDAYYEQKSPPSSKEEGDFQVVSFDGKGVPIIKAEAAKIQAKLGKGEKRQKKKEALVGVSYTVDRKERAPEDLAERLINPEAVRLREEKECVKKEKYPKGQNIRRLASIQRSKKEVMEVIKQDAESRDPTNKRPLVVLLDGALGLWFLVIILFANWNSRVTYILDIIHVRDYIWEVANALYGEKSVAGRVWAQEKMEQILKGRVGYVIGGLKQIITKRDLRGLKRKSLEKAITYFHKHKRWMKYDEYLAAGMPVATGVVESACGSVVKNRMEGEGKRWSGDGAEAILLLRSLQKSNDYVSYWRFHTAQERKRLYDSGRKYITFQRLENAA
jgi:hypothetical protein